MVHEPAIDELETFPAMSAEVTTRLLASQDVHYLAVWRIRAPAWERIQRVAQSGGAFIYVPAFSLARQVVQRLGVSLCLAQPQLDLSRGFPPRIAARPSLVGARSQPDDAMEGPEFEGVSPVLLSRRDARVLARFVYLAVESHETHDLHPAESELALDEEELVFLPAVWDPRYIHESSWRLLLSEFDDLVA